MNSEQGIKCCIRIRSSHHEDFVKPEETVKQVSKELLRRVADGEHKNGRITIDITIRSKHVLTTHLALYSWFDVATSKDVTILSEMG
jgi:hypothetical protein